jgi:K+-sensing histidine kinase KdpD
LASHTQKAFGCFQVEVYTLSKQDEPSCTETITEGAKISSPPTFRTSLDTARGHEGELRLWLPDRSLTREERRLLAAFASQGALSMERIRLAHGEKRSGLLDESDRLKSSLLN